MQRRDPRCRRHCSWCKRAVDGRPRPALGGSRSACVSSHAGDAGGRGRVGGRKPDQSATPARPRRLPPTLPRPVLVVLLQSRVSSTMTPCCWIRAIRKSREGRRDRWFSGASSGDAGVYSGGCSAKRATTRCACMSAWIEPIVSASAAERPDQRQRGTADGRVGSPRLDVR